MPAPTRTFAQAQQGQALPLGLAFMLAIALLMLMLFNTGEMTTEKTQVANAADAAVYSGLVWQARTLNFQSYTNRAMVANQVSIAQFVSLASWTTYADRSARNVELLLNFTPFFAIGKILVRITDGIERGVRQAARVAVGVVDGVTSVLSRAQEGMFYASYAATPEVVNTIVKANDERNSAASRYTVGSTLINARAWQQLSTRHSRGDELTRKADVITASRDEFSADRSWRFGFGRFSFNKEGSTRLIQNGDEWEWRAKDGLALVEVPLGWGSAYAEGDGACGEDNCFGFFDNRLLEAAADFEKESVGGYNGVKAYRSLRDLSSDNRDPRLALHVEVLVPNGEARTAEKIAGLGSPSPANGGIQNGLESGKFYTEDVFAGDDIASISAGEVFFKRPVLSDGAKLNVDGETKEEYANLFNPYWDVRLTEVSETQRQVAWALREPGLLAGAADNLLREFVEAEASDLEAIAGEAAVDLLEENFGGVIDGLPEFVLPEN